MATIKRITKVWIESGCLACDACETICPEVFQVQDETCNIRQEALDAEFLKPLSDSIKDAADACPMQLIKTIETQVQEIPDVAKPTDVTRRTAVWAAGVGWLALGGGVVLGGLALPRFMFPNVLEEPDPRIRIGDLNHFARMPIGGVNIDHKSQGIWIIRNDQGIAALNTVCTHLGCITNWQENERKFKCPCHGSGFQQDGINVEGPAPRPLKRL